MHRLVKHNKGFIMSRPVLIGVSDTTRAVALYLCCTLSNIILNRSVNVDIGKNRKIIRIYNECEGRIENSAPMIAVCNHRAFRVMTNGDPE